MLWSMENCARRSASPLDATGEFFSRAKQLLLLRLLLATLPDHDGETGQQHY